MDYPSMRFDSIERVEAELRRMCLGPNQVKDVLTDLVAIFAKVNYTTDKLELQFVYCSDNPKRKLAGYKAYSLEARADRYMVSAQRIDRLEKRTKLLVKRIEKQARDTILSGNGVIIVFSALRLLDEHNLGKSPLRYDITRLYESLEANELLASTQLHLAKHLFNMKFAGEPWEQSISDTPPDKWLNDAARIFELSLPALLEQNSGAITNLVAIVPDENLWEYLYAGRCQFVYASATPSGLSDPVRAISLSDLEVDTSRRLCAAFDELDELKGISRDGSGYVNLRKVLRRSTSKVAVPKILTALRTYRMDSKAHRLSDERYESIANAIAAELWLEKRSLAGELQVGEHALTDLVGARIVCERQISAADEPADAVLIPGKILNGEEYTISRLLQRSQTHPQHGDVGEIKSARDDSSSVEIVCALASTRDLIACGRSHTFTPLGDIFLKLDRPDTLARSAYLAARERSHEVADNHDLMERVLQDAAQACKTISMANPWRWKSNDYWYRLQQSYTNLAYLFKQAEGNKSLKAWKAEYEGLSMWWDFSIEAGSLGPEPEKRNPFGRGEKIGKMATWDFNPALVDEITHDTESTPNESTISRAAKLKSLLRALSMMFSAVWDPKKVYASLEDAWFPDGQRRKNSRDARGNPGSTLASGTQGYVDHLMPSEAFLGELETYIALMDTSFRSRAEAKTADERRAAFTKTAKDLTEYIGVSSDLETSDLKSPIKQPTLKEVFGRLWKFSMPWHERLWIEALYTQALFDTVTAIEALSDAQKDPYRLHGQLRPRSEESIHSTERMDLTLCLVDQADVPQHVVSAQILERPEYYVIDPPTYYAKENETDLPFTLLFREPGPARVMFRYEHTRDSEAKIDGDAWVYVESSASGNTVKKVEYKIDGPIDNPNAFWGHRDALKTIAWHLQQRALGKTSLRYFHLYGSKSIGKTSTLNMIRLMLKQADTRELLGVSEELGGSSVDWRVIRIKLGDLPAKTAQSLQDAVRKDLSRRDERPTLILIDELDGLDVHTRHNPVLKKIWDLIELQQYHDVTWIIASPFVEESHLLFRKLGRPITLGNLRPAEARNLINVPLSGHGISFLPEAEALLLAASGGHPHVIQAICHTIMSRWTGGGGFISMYDVQAAVDRQIKTDDHPEIPAIHKLCSAWWETESGKHTEVLLQVLADQIDRITDPNAAVSRGKLQQQYEQYLEHEENERLPRRRPSTPVPTFSEALLEAEDAGFIKSDQSGNFRFYVPMFGWWIRLHFPL